jgi:hypothetical protein
MSNDQIRILYLLIYGTIVFLAVWLDSLYKRKQYLKDKLKCKLLRKVHRQFEIVWHPDGVILWREQHPPCYQVCHPYGNKYYFTGRYSKQECFDQAKEWILKTVREEYSHLKTKKLHKPVKVWH